MRTHRPSPALQATSDAAICLSLLLPTGNAAADWPRFRGDNGSGVSQEADALPTQWSEAKNLRWTAELPGAGNSSPIVVSGRVIVTCWSGKNPPADLKRHLVCFDSKTGQQLWVKEVAPAAPDEPYRGMFTENGYASHTPASDGERIFAFFGLSGVMAFDLAGNELWTAKVGAGVDPNQWGTASSPILYNDLVIVTAAAESTSLVALRKDDGKEVWRQEGEGLSGCWGTPVLVDAAGRQELAIFVPGELWGLNPDNGKLRWYALGPRSRTVCNSAAAHDGIVYAIGGRDGGSMAVRAGGKGDVTNSQIVWDSAYRGGISTAVVDGGLIYNVNG
ncbi:MAG: PQQ-binding-like beta-propeller repeat protein, partial [Pirellulales bacterium]|nr:PQQ-binding-like beta-propeller repeat protein [Pirellulales bacterium]